MTKKGSKMGEKVKNDMEKEHLVADILDNLSHNFGLTPKQVYRSYIYYKSHKRCCYNTKDYKEKGRRLYLFGPKTCYKTTHVNMKI